MLRIVLQIAAAVGVACLGLAMALSPARADCKASNLSSFSRLGKVVDDVRARTPGKLLATWLLRTKDPNSCTFVFRIDLLLPDGRIRSISFDAETLKPVEIRDEHNWIDAGGRTAMAVGGAMASTDASAARALGSLQEGGGNDVSADAGSAAGGHGTGPAGDPAAAGQGGSGAGSASDPAGGGSGGGGSGGTGAGASGSDNGSSSGTGGAGAGGVDNGGGGNSGVGSGNGRGGGNGNGVGNGAGSSGTDGKAGGGQGNGGQGNGGQGNGGQGNGGQGSGDPGNGGQGNGSQSNADPGGNFGGNTG
jgi:hypothetical protein